MSAAFYCVADSRYFLGAVGLVNSLRLVGHREPIYLLDCGLDDEQRRLLEGEVTLVGAPQHAPPTLLKTIAPLAHPADVMVLIDTDLIVTRRLEEPIAAAARGRVVAFRNDTERHVPEWGELLDLGPVRPQPYVSFAPRGVRSRAGNRGPTAASRAPGANRLRAHLLARAPDHRLPAAVRRPGRAERDPGLPGRARSPRWRSTRRWRRCRRSAACGSSTSAPCAAPTPTGSSPTSSTTGSPNRGSSRPTTASTRACCAGCWSARSSRSGSPSA